MAASRVLRVPRPTARTGRVSWLLCFAAHVAILSKQFVPSEAAPLPMHPDAAALNPAWRIDEPGLGTWETCDTCEQCVLDPVPGGMALPTPEPGTDGKVRCKKCLGCSVILTRLQPSQPMLGKDVKIFTGASGAAVLKGVTAEKGSVFVKTWCGLAGGYRQTPRNQEIPKTCAKDGLHLREDEKSPCGDRGGIFGWSECNFAFLNALDSLALDANLSSATPRTWTETMRSFLPTGGYGAHEDNSEFPPDPSGGTKVDSVRAQFYEPAPGVSVEAFFGEGATDRVLGVARRIKHDQVVKAAVFDLLFSEQDRHGQNVFVSEDGDVVVLDNEGSFGPVNSMLLPGGQKFEIYRIGYGAVCCGNLPGGKPKNCPGKQSETSAPEVWVDYRCHIPGRFVGTNLPPGVEPFLRRVEKMSADEVFQFYKMAHPKHARALKQKVDDMLDGGFERALLATYARQTPGNGEDYGNDFFYGVHPPCCATHERGCVIRGAKIREPGLPVWQGNEPGKEASGLWIQGTVKLPDQEDQAATQGSSGPNNDGKADEDAETARRRNSARKLLSYLF